MRLQALTAGLCIGLFELAGCNQHQVAATSGQPAVVIAQVRADRTAFDPAKQEKVSFRFNLSEPADVVLSIYDGRDHQVAREDGGRLDRGDQTLMWDGKDATGALVPPEAYTYTLTARNAKGESVYDLSDLTGGAAVSAADVRWDAATGTVRYTLDRPARVNLRLGLQAGPYLRTLIDWVPRSAGAHAEHWDGKDASGVLSLTNNPALTPVVKAYSLPDNALFVGEPPDHLKFVAERNAAVMRAHTGPLPAKHMYDNSQQPLDSRGDMPAILRVEGKFQRDAEGRLVVSGDVPLTANVRDQDRLRVLQRRFEAVFYVDGVFAHENELGYLPLSWTWNTAQFNPGEHFVTLNIRGYEGNFGTATIKVLVQPTTAAKPDGKAPEAP